MTQPELAAPNAAGVGASVDFREASAESRVEQVPLAHLSVELGHFYVEDLAAGPGALRQRFRDVRPWAAVVQDPAAVGLPGGKRPRVSTCFLVDDYSGPIGPPPVVVPEILAAARDSGLDIDYLARESSCVEAGGVELARLVEARIVPDPPPDTRGVRPLLAETGWLSNGERSPAVVDDVAMGSRARWRPPRQSAARHHSVFVDVELWDGQRDERTWSCAFLAAVWQTLRLGVLRSQGASVVTPQPLPEDLPAQWERLPAVIQLNPRAAPFSAYRTLSILPGRFFPTEHAVHTILSQVAVEAAIARQVLDRARAEGLPLPAELVDRVQYVFLGGRASEDGSGGGPGPAKGTRTPPPRAAGTARSGSSPSPPAAPGEY